jgi:hypothetical protein
MEREKSFHGILVDRITISIKAKYDLTEDDLNMACDACNDLEIDWVAIVEQKLAEILGPSMTIYHLSKTWISQPVCGHFVKNHARTLRQREFYLFKETAFDKKCIACVKHAKKFQTFQIGSKCDDCGNYHPVQVMTDCGGGKLCPACEDAHTHRAIDAVELVEMRRGYCLLPGAEII